VKNTLSLRTWRKDCDFCGDLIGTRSEAKREEASTGDTITKKELIARGRTLPKESFIRKTPRNVSRLEGGTRRNTGPCRRGRGFKISLKASFIPMGSSRKARGERKKSTDGRKEEKVSERRVEAGVLLLWRRAYRTSVPNRMGREEEKEKTSAIFTTPYLRATYLVTVNGVEQGTSAREEKSQDRSDIRRGRPRPKSLLLSMVALIGTPPGKRPSKGPL